MALDLTTFAPGLKAYYANGFMQNMVYKNNPLLALMPKMESFYGKNLPIPIIYGNPTGRSATFATAQANKNNSLLKDFVLTRSHDYSVASIDNETMEASGNDKGAFMSALTVETDGAVQASGRSLAVAMYRDGTGQIGTILAASSVTGTTLTLTTISDITNYEVGMKLQFSVDMVTLRDSGDVATVTAVNRATGVLTFAAALTSIAAIAAGDFILVQGDQNAKVSGLEAWMPQTVSATTFFGVDRTADPTRLAGIKYDGSLQPIEEALIDGLSLLEREGGSPDYCMMSYANLSNLKKALGTKVQYVDVKGPANLSFKGVQIDGNKRPVTVLGDQNCPSARAYYLQMDTWKLYSLKECPRILNADGNKMLREATSDATEIRIGYYAQVGCNAPGWNGVVKLAS